MTRKILAAGFLAFSLLISKLAFAQNAPNWYYGKVPTTAEWAAAWSAKQDYLGAAPCLVTGCVMQGRLVTVAPSTRSGLNLTPGAGAPSSLFDGDLWVTTSGIFARVNGSTVGPLASTPAGSTCTNQVVVAVLSGVPTCASITNARLSPGTFSNITGTGTLTAGATGTGFTVNLGSSTITGNLPIANLASGSGASSSTFLRGDNTWATPPGSGTVTSAQIAAGTGIAVSGTCTITTSGTCTVSQSNTMGANKFQVFTSGSGTITTPTGATWVKFRIVGGGGGGAGGGTASGGTGGTGGNSCINTSGAACTTPVYQSAGGTGGNYSSSTGGTGGPTSGSSSCSISITGGEGESITQNFGSTAAVRGSMGGNSSLGGAGAKSPPGAAGAAAASNSGSGGQGGGGNAVANSFSGPGGAAGATCVAFIQSPAASYTYAVGTAGTAGTAGTNGQAGGAGGSGLITAEYGFN